MSDEQEPPATRRTLCHTCGGSGVVPRERAAVMRGQAVTLVAPERCPHCPVDPDSKGRAGLGWLPGFQPPV